MFIKWLSALMLCLQLDALHALVVQTSDGETMELNDDDIQALHSGFINGYLATGGEFAEEVLEVPVFADVLRALLGLARKDEATIAFYSHRPSARHINDLITLIHAVDILVMPTDIIAPLLEKQYIFHLHYMRKILKEKYGYTSGTLLSLISRIIKQKTPVKKKPIRVRRLTEEEEADLA